MDLWNKRYRFPRNKKVMPQLVSQVKEEIIQVAIKALPLKKFILTTRHDKETNERYPLVVKSAK